MAKKKETVLTDTKRAKATTHYMRISPRKLRNVIDTVRYKPIYQAFGALSTIRQKGARLTEKVLKSAVANAKDLGMEEERLYVSQIFANGGPTLKRFRPRSMGRADRILKRTSHLSIALLEGTKRHKRPGLPAVEEAVEETLKSKKAPRKKATAGKS